MSSTNRIKVICFYTQNTPYQQEVIHLQHSCKHFGIDIEITPLKSKGSWEKNVAMKPRFILEKMQTLDQSLFWVDADAVFLKKPDFSLFHGVDFSVRFMEIFQNDPKYALNAATLFINHSEEAKKLVEKWVKRAEELCKEEVVPFVDQIALYEVLLHNQTAKILPMPVSYCKVFDIDTFFIDDEDVIIEQRQASRRYK